MTSSQRAILDSLPANLPKDPVSTGYKLGLAAVAIAMVLLPVLYLALTALAAVLVYLHATFNTWILDSGGGILRLLFYFGPIIAGIVLVLFMAKPLFAQSPAPPSLRRLERKDEPFLFEFVERLCQAVGAPVPANIEIDLQANASAGGDLGLVTRKHDGLTLGIGLPLVAGLSLNEFAGVLAHEFGHFSQGVGMRLSRAIRSINGWFARVVYERDEWDVSLQRWQDHEFAYISAIAGMSAGCVWVSRRVLTLLMTMGHAISCFLMRQMELDADRYEVRLVGADVFESTMTRLWQLDAGGQLAFDQLAKASTVGIYLRDIPEAVRAQSQALPGDLVDQIGKQIASTSTGALDTHPAPRERIEHARQTSSGAPFQVDGPASMLFDDFASLSETATRDFYRTVIGHTPSEQQLVRHTEVGERQQAIENAGIVAKRYYQETLYWFAPILSLETVGHDEARARLAAARETFHERLWDFHATLKRLGEAEGLLIEVRRYPFQRAHGLPDPHPETVVDAGQEDEEVALAEARCMERAEAIADWRECLSARLGAAAALASDSQKCRSLVAALAVLADAYPWAAAVLREILVAEGLVDEYELVEGLDPEESRKRFQDCRIANLEPPPNLRDAAMPFDEDGAQSVMEFLRSHVGGGSLDNASTIASAYFGLYFRIMNELAVIAEDTESELGLKPIELREKKPETTRKERPKTSRRRGRARSRRTR